MDLAQVVSLRPAPRISLNRSLVPIRVDIALWHFPEGILVQPQASAETQRWHGHSLTLMIHFIQIRGKYSRNTNKSAGAVWCGYC